MLSNSLYFEIPSNTVLNASGNYVIYVHNEDQVEFTVELTNNEAEVSIVDINYSSVLSTIEIFIKSDDENYYNKDFTITIKNIYGYSDTIKLNTGVPSHYFNIVSNKTINVGYYNKTANVVYQIVGYSPNDIEIIYDKVTNFANKTIDIRYANEHYKTMNLYFNGSNPWLINIYGKNTESEDWNLIRNEYYVPVFYFREFIKTFESKFGYKYLKITSAYTTDETNYVFVGFAESKNIFVENAIIDRSNETIKFELSYNLGEKTPKSQSVNIRCGSSIHYVTFNQEESPYGYYFNYDSSNLPAIFTPNIYTFDVDVTLTNHASLTLDYEIVDANTNVTGIEKPYTITYQKLANKNIRLTITTYDKESLLRRYEEQEMELKLQVFDQTGARDNYIEETINIKFNAAGLVYGSGSITANENGITTGSLKLLPNRAKSIVASNMPRWIDANNIVFDKLNNEIYISSVDTNIFDYTREANIIITFEPEDGEPPLGNTLELKVIQSAASDAVKVYKTFEDFIITPSEDSTQHISISNPEKPSWNTSSGNIYSGNIIDSVNLTKFAKSLFSYKENIFESSFTDLKLNKTLVYSLGDQQSTEVNYIYDYSYDKEDHFNISEICQPIDYYDPRQYIFESIYVTNDLPIGIALNNRNFYDIYPNNKYNITMRADGVNTLQLNWYRGVGKLFKSKCTNAKYAVYYMNLYGGWNWMLFDSNKQVLSNANTFNYMLGNNLEQETYKIETKTTYNLTSLFLTDEGSKMLKHLYKSPIVYIHILDTDELKLVNVDTKSYQEKTFINQGRKYFTQNISLTEAKNKFVY